MATAELAVALPVLAVLLMFGIGALGAVGAQLRCEDAARLAARAAARGEPDAVVRKVAADAAPKGAQISLSVVGSTVTVAVVAEVGIPGPWAGHGPRQTLRGRSEAALEQSPLGALQVGLPAQDGARGR